MKTFRFLSKILVLMMVILPFVLSCEEKSENDPQLPLDPGLVSDRLRIPLAVKRTGEMPKSPKITDMQMDKDTIFLLEDFDNRIRFRNSDLKGQEWSIYIQVAGASSYWDIEPDPEESSDSLGVIYWGIDPNGLDLPISFDVDIYIHDRNGKTFDNFKRVVKVEKKGSASCTPWSSGDQWIWLYTNVGNQLYFSAPGKPVGIVASTNGCCLEGQTVDCIANNIPEEDWVELEYAVYEMGNLEYMTLKSDGTMKGELIEQTQNLNYQGSDFCAKSPAYNRRTNYNKYDGKFTFDPSNQTMAFTEIVPGTKQVYVPQTGQTYTEYDRCYVGPHATYEIIGCRWIIETSRAGGEGPSSEKVRLFERRKTPISKENGEYAIWFD